MLAEGPQIQGSRLSHHQKGRNQFLSADESSRRHRPENVRRRRILHFDFPLQIRESNKENCLADLDALLCDKSDAFSGFDSFAPICCNQEKVIKEQDKTKMCNCVNACQSEKTSKDSGAGTTTTRAAVTQPSRKIMSGNLRHRQAPMKVVKNPTRTPATKSCLPSRATNLSFPRHRLSYI
ncbi:hypothetical protein L596_028262 [Steinernema carpocapsae]|uniref:Uncharacterized protein n=1 Tax=Steinernema carpocapsae TaxID=34508 RepID=A0A4U5LY00_STECR|nr:hypothetical protein L596_028262 [Steinernema carpocapsae]